MLMACLQSAVMEVLSFIRRRHPNRRAYLVLLFQMLSVCTLSVHSLFLSVHGICQAYNLRSIGVNKKLP
eukprot:1281046-Karenia_brevis.AAC.1